MCSKLLKKHYEKFVNRLKKLCEKVGNYLEKIARSRLWSVVTGILLIILFLVFYLLGIQGAFKISVFLILLTIVTFLFAWYLLLLRNFLLRDFLNGCNVLISFVLCAFFFFIKNEMARTDEIDQVFWYRTIIAILDVFLVFAGTIIMDLLFKWFKSQNSKKLESEKNKKAESEKKKEEAEKDSQ